MVDPKYLPEGVAVVFREIDLTTARKLAQYSCSAVGHTGTSSVMSNLLEVTLPLDQTPLKLIPGQQFVVFQISKVLSRKLNDEDYFEEIMSAWKRGAAKFVLVTLLPLSHHVFDEILTQQEDLFTYAEPAFGPRKRKTRVS